MMGDTNSKDYHGYVHKEGVVYLNPEDRQAKLEFIESGIRNVLVEYGERCGIDGVLIWGSWARGNPHTMSDLDILTLSRSEPSYQQIKSFETMLQDELYPTDIYNMATVIYTVNEGIDIVKKERLYSSGFWIVTVDPQLHEIVQGLLGRRAKN